MAARTRDTSLGVGVYYAHDDYVGLMPRMVILVVDFVVLVSAGFVGFGIVYLASKIIPVHPAILYFGCFLVHMLLIWLYLTALKASRIRTVGYWITGSRIVNLRGERPSMFRMTFREVIWMLGPISLLFDLLFWLCIDDDRQTFRDRYAGTCVVKNQAEPKGTAKIYLNYYNTLGFALAYRRVVGPTSGDGDD